MVIDDVCLVLWVLVEVCYDGGEVFNGMCVCELLCEGG